MCDAQRVGCCIDGCRRTTKRRPDEVYLEFICAVHWGRIPKRKRAIYHRAKKRYKENKTAANCAAASRLWERMKTLAWMMGG